MRPSMKAIAFSFAFLWGGCLLVVGLINLADPHYGGEFLRMMNSVYPGADSARTIAKVLLGTLYGFCDGLVGGFLFTWLYRLFAGTGHKEAHLS